MDRVTTIISLVRKQIKGFIVPVVTVVAQQKHDPFLVLISCILSLRTKDKTTVDASTRLFKVAHTPQRMARLDKDRLAHIIYPVGFYRNKAEVILALCHRLVGQYKGNVPATFVELTSFKGVGRKTANLVLGLGFGIPAICVDTHVHRISNRLGWVRTNDPEETEYALEKIVPKRLWIELNTDLVAFGQNICLPVSPYCSKCLVRKYCARIEVKRSR